MLCLPLEQVFPSVPAPTSFGAFEACVGNPGFDDDDGNG